MKRCVYLPPALLVSVCVQVLKKIARYIKDQNEKIFAPRGLLLTDPIERGLRVVSSLISVSPLLQTNLHCWCWCNSFYNSWQEFCMFLNSLSCRLKSQFLKIEVLALGDKAMRLTPSGRNFWRENIVEALFLSSSPPPPWGKRYPTDGVER